MMRWILPLVACLACSHPAPPPDAEGWEVPTMAQVDSGAPAGISVDTHAVVVRPDTQAKRPPKPRARSVKETALVRSSGWWGGDPGNAEGRLDVEVAQAIIDEHPDTLIALARNFYRAQEPSFPVAIADDFERGVSTELITYPRIHLLMNIYRNDRSEKPYRVERYTVWMEDGSVRVER